MLEKFNLSDLKIMTNEELKILSEEIREKIINTVSKNGGHLSSNLGVVELTIALHKTFNSPHDKFIFDVSHQTYTHKILTGRLNRFDTLRKYNGISGFAKCDESVHDAWEAGHSSTSISAGLGFIEARKSGADIGEVIAIIGDASISNGLSFEAINYLGAHKDDKMIIIINDNNMSVSKNVGALAKRYNKIRTRQSMKFFKKITPIRIKHALQYYAYKVDLFTSLGFKYFENIDGHSFSELSRYLEYAKNSTQSVVLHVKTKKGKGYPLCENDSNGMWHSVGAFDINTGALLNKKSGITYGEAISGKLEELTSISKNNDIRVIYAAMGLGCGVESYTRKYPNNSIDVGIAEENSVVMAAAMAKNGLKPVIFMYSTFLQRCYDEIIHDIARPGYHVVFAIDHAGIVDGDGSTHQGIYDLSFLYSIPGLTILSPTTPLDASLMIEYAINNLTGPVIIRYNKGSIEQNKLYFNNNLNWNIVLPSKNNTYVISYGKNIIDLENLIINNKLSCGLINALCLDPIDTNMIDKLSLKRSKLIIYEDVIKNGSLFTRIISYLSLNNIKLNIKSYSLDNTYLPVATTEEIKKMYHISLDDLKDDLEDVN